MDESSVHYRDVGKLHVTATGLGFSTNSRQSKANCLYLQLWGLLLGYGNMTYASDWRYFSPGTAQWQVCAFDGGCEYEEPTSSRRQPNVMT